MSKTRRHDPRDLAPETLLPTIATWLRPELPGLTRRADLGVLLLDSGLVEVEPEDVVAALEEVSRG